ncbi:MAG: hypothetical protein E4H02_03480 [Lentisphaerales bacterium]|jgi:putative membrane protein|nr:MAG: hypothetical protein E4H02_03480 [Lentisphaerales bacterium]
MIIPLVSSAVGAVIGSILGCVPGLHVYNLIGLLVAFSCERPVASTVAVPFVVGLTVGYAMLNTVPSVFFATPDESAFFVILPGQKYLKMGRGCEAVMITAVGGMIGILLIVLVAGPLLPRVLPSVYGVVRPHMHWILWCVIVFMVMSEWPKLGNFGQGGWRKLMQGWKTPAVGLLTFLLAGFLGFIVMYRPAISADASFQGLLPAFAGLFTLPWLFLNIVSSVSIPRQATASGPGPGLGPLLTGGLAGGLGGGFAAVVPAVTGGVGGFLAGHAVAIRNDAAFLASQGASKVVYYVLGLLLLFVPSMSLARGGAARMISTLYVPQGMADYSMVIASIAIAGAAACLLVSPLSRATAALAGRLGYRRASIGALVIVVLVVGTFTGAAGLFIMSIAAGIGLIPLLFGSRRMNCLGVILLPVACNMSGIGPAVAGALGLL